MTEFDNHGRGPNDELPPDPEDMNEDRAAWAETALKAFQELTGTDDGDAVSDLIADLMHLCDREPDRFGASFRRQLERGFNHYDEETTEFRCEGCGRAESDCSASPCAAVLAERED